MSRWLRTLASCLVILTLAACSSGVGTSSPSGAASSQGAGPQASASPAGASSSQAPVLPTPVPGKVYHVSVDIIVSNDPVNLAYAGFKKTMAANGYIDGQNVIYNERNALGVTANSELIARQSVEDKPDVIFVIGTPIIIAVQSLTSTIPVVFSLSGDPVAGGFAKSLDHPGMNITGTTGIINSPDYFNLLQKLLPNCKTVGLMGNTGEQNSAIEIKAFQAEAAARGLTTQVAVTPKTSDIPQAVSSLQGRVQCILVGGDGTVLAAIGSLVQSVDAAKLPTIISGTSYAAQGILAGIGPDWTQCGISSAKQMIQVLNGANPADTPIVPAASLGVGVDVNKDVAATLGVTIPSDLGATLVTTSPNP